MGHSSRSDEGRYGGNDVQTWADGRGDLLDRILEGLARPRSRYVLYCLADEEPRELDELAAAVAELEAETQPTAEQRERVKISIYHNVLPRLDDLRLVEYDARSKTVCFRQTPEELREFLQLSRQLDASTA